jgi:hypothetical protein
MEVPMQDEAKQDGPQVSRQTSNIATLLRELSVRWHYDGPGGYAWHAIRGGQRKIGRADTEAEAWSAGSTWLSELDEAGAPRCS